MTDEFLTLDGFNLLMDDDTQDIHGCTVQALEGSHWGNSEGRTKVLSSLMRNGELVADDGFGNRAPSIPIRIKGPTLGAVAKTERDLSRLTGGPATLRWHPPDLTAETCVFDVLWSKFNHEMDDFEETNCIRYGTLDMVAWPFSRDETMTVSLALPAPPTTVVDTEVDAGSSATGWTQTWAGSTSTAATTSGGKVIGTSGTTGNTAQTLIRAGAITMTGTPYLVVRALVKFENAPGQPSALSYNPSWVNVNLFAASQPGVPISFVAAKPQPDGHIDYYFNMTGVTIPAGGFVFNTSWGSPSPFVMTLQIDQVRKTSHLPTVSRRQVTRAIDVGGSAPTEGTLHAYGVNGVGEALLYTYPRDLRYQPPMSPYYTSGGGTPVTDPAFFSGSYRSLSTPRVYDIPASALPAGTHTLAVAAYAADTGGAKALDLTLVSRQDGVNVGPVITRVARPIMDLAAWRIYPLDLVTIPTPVGPDGFLRLTIGRNAATTSTVYLDEVFMLHTSGEFTLLNYGGNHVWVDAPTPTTRTPEVWVGTDADRSNSWSAVGIARYVGNHMFEPGGTQVFGAFNGSDNVAIDLAFHRKHQNHVAAEGP